MHRKRMKGRSGPGIVSAKFPRLLTSIGRRGFASKAEDYSVLRLLIKVEDEFGEPRRVTRQSPGVLAGRVLPAQYVVRLPL